MSRFKRLSEIPDASTIASRVERIDYFDCYMTWKKNEYTIREIKERVLALPLYVRFLLKVRYYLLVKPFGMKTGRKEVPVLFENMNEIVIGEDDKHLYYSVSMMKRDDEIYMTTIVRFNNLWGKIYFTFIKPFHKIVVKSLLKKI